MDVFSVTSDSLFSPVSSDYSTQMQNMSLRTLNKALGQYTAGHYDQAIATFKQAVNFAPTSDSAVNALDYMARSYLAQGDSQSAIAAYQKAIKAAPTRDDLYVDLGHIYTTNQDYTKALAQYQLAVKNNASAANL